MKRILSIALLVFLMAAVMVTPASAQDTSTEDNDLPFLSLWDEGMDLEAELAACISENVLLNMLIEEHELGIYMEEFSLEDFEMEFEAFNHGCCKRIPGCFWCRVQCDLPHPPYCRETPVCQPCLDCSSCNKGGG